MESLREENIQIDLFRKNYMPLSLKQYDTTKLNFIIYKNGVITNLSGNSFVLNFIKGDKTLVIQTSGFDTTQLSSGKVGVTLVEDCLRATGEGKIELQILKDSKLISNFVLPCKIDGSVVDSVPSSNLVTLTEELNETIQEGINTKDDLEIVIATADTTTYATKGEINTVNSLLEEIAVNVKQFIFLVENWEEEDADWTPAIQAAINSIMTLEYTEAIPTEGAKGTVYIPPDRYGIYSTITIPSYVSLKGAGRHTTILDSFITNGDPLIQFSDITDSVNNRAFYSSLESFSINGKRNACQGIKIYRTSRWIIKDVIIDRTGYEGLNVYSAFLGEVYSTLVRACGDATHYSVVLSGTNSSSGGSHSVNFYGGEINGGTGAVHGVYAEYGNAIGFNGTAIEGFSTGRGLTVKNANSLYVRGYFELNKENIVEIGNTLGNAYEDSIFADLATGARGHIGITYAQGCKISGNYFQGDATKVKIFDATSDGSGKLYMSYVGCNYSTAFPIAISQSLIDSARTSGTVIETFDSASSVRRYGNHSFADMVEFLADLRPTGGIKNIGGFTRSNIVGNNGSPEGVVTADPGSICLNGSDTTDRSTTAYLKANGVNNSTGWLPIQGIQAGTTANRPTVTKAGYQYFDATLDKPIWWNGSVWKDATGATV